MTITVGDVFTAETAAAEPGGTSSGPEQGAGAPAGPRVARTHARILATVVAVKDALIQSWVLTDTPPSLREVVRARIPDEVPGGSDPLRAGWVAWNFAVAIPTTAVLYALAWMLQHPARAAVLALVVGPVGFFWITR
jgi:hypothetical protein